MEGGGGLIEKKRKGKNKIKCLYPESKKYKITLKISVKIAVFIFFKFKQL